MEQDVAAALQSAIEQCRRSHARLLTGLVQLDDEQVRAASRLPSWSRGHVLSHLARQGDSVVRRLRAAMEGRVVDQYLGGSAERNTAIEQGATRSAAAILADLRDSIAAVDEVMAECSEVVWDRPVRSVDGPEHPARSLVGLRWQEVEIHHVDLDLGYELGDWPAEFVDLMFTPTVAGLIERANPNDLVGWLIGRGTAPTLSPWD